MSDLESRLNSHPVKNLKSILRAMKQEIGSYSKMKKAELVARILQLKNKKFPVPNVPVYIRPTGKAAKPAAKPAPKEAAPKVKKVIKKPKGTAAQAAKEAAEKSKTKKGRPTKPLDKGAGNLEGALQESGVFNRAQAERLTLTLLKKVLRDRNQKQSGTKAELVNRVLATNPKKSEVATPKKKEPEKFKAPDGRVFESKADYEKAQAAEFLGQIQVKGDDVKRKIQNIDQKTLEKKVWNQSIKILEAGKDKKKIEDIKEGIEDNDIEETLRDILAGSSESSKYLKNFKGGLKGFKSGFLTNSKKIAEVMKSVGKASPKHSTLYRNFYDIITAEVSDT